MTGSSEETPPVRGLDAARDEATRGLPPVHLWNPPHQGMIDMRIRRDGVWEYRGSPITRQAMVRLFSTILRREPDGSYVLVTPVERVGITVDDAPFLAVGLEAQGEGRHQSLSFRTSVGDTVRADSLHPIRIAGDPTGGEPAPYVLVRARLEALIARAVWYDLVDLAREYDIDGQKLFGVWSAGSFFPFAPASDVSL